MKKIRWGVPKVYIGIVPKFLFVFEKLFVYKRILVTWEGLHDFRWRRLTNGKHILLFWASNKECFKVLNLSLILGRANFLPLFPNSLASVAYFPLWNSSSSVPSSLSSPSSISSPSSSLWFYRPKKGGFLFFCWRQKAQDCKSILRPWLNHSAMANPWCVFYGGPRAKTANWIWDHDQITHGVSSMKG